MSDWSPESAPKADVRSEFFDSRGGLFRSLVRFHISGSGVTELFRLGSLAIAHSLDLASVRAGKHLEDEFDTAGSFGFQS
jgi:hypothetical protein